VGDGAKVYAALDPSEVRGRRRGKFRVLLSNRDSQPVSVELRGSADGHLAVGFAHPSVGLKPREQVAVSGFVEAPSLKFVGSADRLPFLVRVQGHTTPVTLDGTFAQRPVLAGGFLRTALLVGVLGLWGLIVAFTLLHANSKNNEVNLSKLPTGVTSTTTI